MRLRKARKAGPAPEAELPSRGPQASAPSGLPGPAAHCTPCLEEEDVAEGPREGSGTRPTSAQRGPGPQGCPRHAWVPPGPALLSGPSAWRGVSGAPWGATGPPHCARDVHAPRRLLKHPSGRRAAEPQRAAWKGASSRSPHFPGHRPCHAPPGFHVPREREEQGWIKSETGVPPP